MEVILIKGTGGGEISPLLFGDFQRHIFCLQLITLIVVLQQRINTSYAQALELNISRTGAGIGV